MHAFKNDTQVYYYVCTFNLERGREGERDAFFFLTEGEMSFIYLICLVSCFSVLRAAMLD